MLAWGHTILQALQAPEALFPLALFKIILLQINWEVKNRKRQPNEWRRRNFICHDDRGVYRTSWIYHVSNSGFAPLCLWVHVHHRQSRSSTRCLPNDRTSHGFKLFHCIAGSGRFSCRHHHLSVVGNEECFKHLGKQTSFDVSCRTYVRPNIDNNYF